MKRAFLLILCVVTSGLSTAAQDPVRTPPKPPAKHEIVTAAQANGVYRYYQSEFRILALGHNKLKVQFDGIYMTVSRSPNMGYASGEATIAGNVATFVPADTQGCKITMTFLPGKLKVTQDGSDADCGFGHNVYATGTYRKIRSGKPKFESPP
ncbi:MAG TPA: hypothetical protein VK117_00515 [Pyrinomonadaceae bacterium]|nr:hypothetical protein [Pyrinomonadaceae bacterium]